MEKDIIKPVHKENSTDKETNYRGISLSSCLAKFFNNLILNRLSSYFEKQNIFHPHVMGFRPGMKTVNNVMVLKTLIEKQFGNSTVVLWTFQKLLIQYGEMDY